MKVVLKNLTKVFTNKKTKSEVRAVDNLDIEIPDGKLIGLLGPSGCGKSTTLYMVSGLQAPTEGRIIFGEDDVTELAPEKRGIGLVFQNYALYPHMTVEQNIMFPLQNMRVPKEEAKAKALEAARLVQIDNLMDRKPSELSGGQQQRVAIARALVKEPNVLLLDEPLSNLDARLRLQTREEIKRIQKETGVTTIFVTHDQEEAMSISDYIVVMKLGVMQQMDEPQKVYDNPVNLFVAKFLGTPPINVFNATISNGVVYIGEEAVEEIDLLPVLEVNLQKRNDAALANFNRHQEYMANKKPEKQKKIDEIVEAEPMEFVPEELNYNENEPYKAYVGIRPEGFVIDPNGKFTLHVEQVEVMGRDISIIVSHPNCEKPTARIIVDASEAKGVNVGEDLKFSLKPGKIFVFDGYTEERLK